MSVFLHSRVMGTFDACRPLTHRDVDELESIGIPPDTLAGPIPVAASTVYFDGDRFEFEHHHHCYDDQGVRAFMFLITNPWNEAIDIVAWSPSLGKLATWLGWAWALGEETVFSPRLTDHGALPVHRSPVGWLRARREGIVIVRPEVAALCLEYAGPLIAEDPDHLVELKRLLTRPAPTILVDADKLALASTIKDFENDCVR